MPDVTACGDTRFASIAVLLKYLEKNSLASVPTSKALRLSRCIPYVDALTRKADADTSL